MLYCGDRAVAETRMMLLVRADVAGCMCDVTCWGRFHDRLVRIDEAWRILSRVPIYDKDRLDPLEPGAVPVIDREALGGFAEGYRHIAYVQSLGGAALTPGLPTLHSPEEALLREAGERWLAGGPNGTFA